MGMLDQMAKMAGKSPKEIQAALTQAMKMVGGVNQSNNDEVARFLQEQGIETNMVDKLLKKADPYITMAKMAKPFIPALKDVDIDGMISKARQFSRGYTPVDNGYGVRDTNPQTYTRAGKLPD
jgi:hypothetical protein